MSEVFTSSSFSLLITIAGYLLGLKVKEKFNFPLFNPIIVGTIFVVLLLKLTGVSYVDYQNNTSILNFLLLPATIALAIPLYKQLDTFKRYRKAVLVGILTGVTLNYLIVFGYAILMNFSIEQFNSLSSKSVTTAIGMSLTDSFGGLMPLTNFSIMAAGLTGNILGPKVIEWINLKNPVAKGIALGCSSHVMGTSKAIEMGEVEGALSSLAIVLTGLITMIFMLLLNPIVVKML